MISPGGAASCCSLCIFSLANVFTIKKLTSDNTIPSPLTFTPDLVLCCWCQPLSIRSSSPRRNLSELSCLLISVGISSKDGKWDLHLPFRSSPSSSAKAPRAFPGNLGLPCARGVGPVSARGVPPWAGRLSGTVLFPAIGCKPYTLCSGTGRQAVSTWMWSCLLFSKGLRFKF